MPPLDRAGAIAPGVRPVAEIPRRVIALDLSGTVGIAIGTEGMMLPERTETWVLAREGGEGARYASFENELAALLGRYQPAHVILEATLPLPAMNNYAAAAQAFGLRAIARAEAWRASASVSEIDVLTVRREVMALPRLSRDAVKLAVFKFCRKRGIKVESHHAADAALVWMWRAMRLRGDAPVAGPLFMEDAG
jgi:hypothetical protein